MRMRSRRESVKPVVVLFFRKRQTAEVEVLKYELVLEVAGGRGYVRVGTP